MVLKLEHRIYLLQIYVSTLDLPVNLATITLFITTGEKNYT